MNILLPFAIISVLFCVSVMLQQKNSSLGSLMGQDAGDEVAQTRRGAEKFLYRVSLVLAILFLGGGIYAMIA